MLEKQEKLTSVSVMFERGEPWQQDEKLHQPINMYLRRVVAEAKEGG